jgi:hypothetical protein
VSDAPKRLSGLNALTLWFFGLAGWASLTILIGVPVWALCAPPDPFFPWPVAVFFAVLWLLGTRLIVGYLLAMTTTKRK